MGDIFDSLFGGAFGGGFGSRSANPNAPRRGQDVTVTLSIDFMEACNGCKKEITINRNEKCTACNGSGAAAGTTASTCPDCGGSGQVKVTQRTPFGTISTARQCSRCGGKGKVVANPCPSCRGAGRTRVPKKIIVDIPAGINEGQTLQLRGQGDHGTNGGPAGDLNVNITVMKHAIFERDGFDIRCDIPITYTQAVLGDEIIVPTIDGKVKYNIAEGTQNGTVFRLKGKGVKRLNRSDRGDQYVTVYVEVPSGLSKKQKDALKDFEASLDAKNYKKRSSFFDKIKEAFNG